MDRFPKIAAASKDASQGRTVTDYSDSVERMSKFTGTKLEFGEVD
jgi:hypothetical protein